MELVETRERFNFPADAVWDLTGDFGGLHKWLAGAKTCEVSGAGPRDTGGNAERTVTLMDGSITRESLESLDETNRCYSYAILEAKGFNKDTRFIGRFQVLPLRDNSCEIVWQASFTVPEGLSDEKITQMKQRLQQMYGFFLQNLDSVLASL